MCHIAKQVKYVANDLRCYVTKEPAKGKVGIVTGGDQDIFRSS
jgi:hypothetical protein